MVIAMFDRTTTGEWLEQWLSLRSGQLRPRTIERYSELIRKHAAPIADIKLRKLNSSHIQMLLADICASGHERTAEQLFVLLRTAMKAAVQQRRVKVDPMQGVVRPSHKPQPHAIWTLEEQRAVLRALEHDKRKLEILLGLMCGLRRGEICGLMWADVDLAEGLIHVKRQRQRLSNGKLVDAPPKSDAGRRDIPIPEPLRRTIVARAAIGGYVTDLSPEGLSGALRRAEKRAGVAHIGIHGLRHTMATNAVRVGVSLRIVQQLLGHSSFNLTARVYTHPDIDMMRCAVDSAWKCVV